MGAKDPSPRPDHTAQGSCARADTLKVLDVKTSGGWGGGRVCQIFRELRLKGLHGLKMDTNPPPLGFSSRATAGRAPVALRELVKSLEMGQVSGKPPEAQQ